MSNDIGWAVTQMQAGKHVRRHDWDVNKWIALHVPVPGAFLSHPYIYLNRTEHNFTMPYFIPSEDLLATDWEPVA